MGSSEGELSPWVDRAAAFARSDASLTAWEVRGGRHETRRDVLKNDEAQPTRWFRSSGVGVRAWVGSGSGYAFTNELDNDAVRRTVERATRLAAANARSSWSRFAPSLGSPRKASYRPSLAAHPHESGFAEAVELLRRAASGIRVSAPDAGVQCAFGSRRDEVVVASSAGSWVETETVLSTLLASAVARDGARIGEDTQYRGGERGLDGYEPDGGPEGLGEAVGRAARESLRAKALPAGRMRALCDNTLTGLLAHESFGHLTEYDLVACGWSVLRGRLGEELARSDVTIRDAPVAPRRPGEGVVVPIDDEGTTGREVTLLDRGRLASYMHLRDSASATEVSPTGNGRALSVSHPPIVRMRNTYVEPGALTVEEALEELGTGVYLIGGRGGAPRSDGSFMFTANRGYVVEGGEIRDPVRMVSIHGNVLDFLRNVEGLTRDFAVDTNFFGGCGKWDQSFLHVGVGGPHVLVSEALVGGQGA